MGLKKIIALFVGLVGFTMTFGALTQGIITGGVIGTNTTSRFLGVFGVILMLIAIFIERHELTNSK
jgi:hypothetical protein